MSPPEKMPNAVAKARQKLEAAGKEINKESIFETLSKAEINNLSNNMRNHQTPQVAARYREMKSDAERKDWVSHYVIDYKEASCKGWNSTKVVNNNINTEEIVWLTEEQMGGPLYLNSPSHAAIVVKAKILLEQDHELAPLAAAGIKQYEFSWSKVRNETGVMKEAGVIAEDAMSGEDFAAVASHMENSVSTQPVAKKQKVKPAPKIEDPETKELKQAAALRQTALRKLKQKVDKVLQAMVEKDGMLPKILEKGYPQQMMEFMKAKIDELRAKAMEAQETYSSEAKKQNMMPKPALVESTGLLDASLSALETLLKKFDDGTGGDLKRLSA